jgi:hypothetical protein
VDTSNSVPDPSPESPFALGSGHFGAEYEWPFWSSHSNPGPVFVPGFLSR